jgi:hypothetical protein
MKTSKDFSTTREFLQYLIDELNDLPASADGNQAYNRYAAANSQLVSLQADESSMKIRMTSEEKTFLAFARKTASDVKSERQKGRRFEASGNVQAPNRNSRELTDYENESYNQCIRAINSMTTQDKSRQNTAKAIVNFGSGDIGLRIPALSPQHPAKQKLWAEYYRKADETSAIECERLVNKLKNEKNPLHDEVAHLKYLVEKVMPELPAKGAINNVDTSKSYNVLHANKVEAQKIIDKEYDRMQGLKAEPSKDGKTA